MSSPGLSAAGHSVFHLADDLLVDGQAVGEFDGEKHAGWRGEW